MNLEEMKKFAAMTEEERAMAIKKAEWAKEADEEFQSKSLAEIFTYSAMDGYDTLPACRGQPLFGVRDQDELVFYFDRRGEIVSDLWGYIQVEDVCCTNCQSKVKTPQSYIDEWIEEAAAEEGDE